MITLKTLPQATAQEVFDQAANHLLTQNEKSMHGPGCEYKNLKGLKCAAGCFISDKEYNYGVENNSWEELVADKLVPEEHSKLIQGLQYIHDDYLVEEWEEELKSLASRYKLTFTSKQ